MVDTSFWSRYRSIRLDYITNPDLTQARHSFKQSRV
jgi:hypothetical protein